MLFPSHCLACGQRLPLGQPPFFCDPCFQDITYIRPPWCFCCGKPFESGQNQLCLLCTDVFFTFDQVRSAFAYQAPIAPLILSLKFGAQLSAMDSLAALVQQSPACADLAEPDYIIPVPLHHKRLRKRGFNQASTIARFCFPQWREKITFGLLRRSKVTLAQASLGGKERRQNLQNAFSLTRPEHVAGRRILLVDDVFTTGSTVNECSKILHQAGAARIEVFTLARSMYE